MLENRSLPSTTDKLYFCQGCEYFQAMVESKDWTRMESASGELLNRPDLFILTHCTNKENPDDSEGNTNARVCPLVKRV